MKQKDIEPIRLGFKMKVFPEMIEEYIKIHNPIWDELKTVFRDHGVLSYSIFLDRTTNNLFASVLIVDLQQWNKIATTTICQNWWNEMKRLMPSGDDNRPLSFELEEVFHFENTN